MREISFWHEQDDPRVRRRLFSWRMFLLILLVVLVLTVSNVLILELVLNMEVFSVAASMGAGTYWVAMALLAVSIVLPIMFRLGTEKGRMVYLLAIGLQMAMYFVLSDATQGMSAGSLTVIWLAVLAASAAVSVGSVCVSNALYTARLTA